MSLFLLLHGATVLTLRALMGRLPWELKLQIPVPSHEHKAPSRELKAVHPILCGAGQGLMPAARSPTVHEPRHWTSQRSGLGRTTGPYRVGRGRGM